MRVLGGHLATTSTATWPRHRRPLGHDIGGHFGRCRARVSSSRRPLRHTSAMVQVAVPSWQEVLRIVVPFAIAWLVARVSGRLAEWIVRRSEARQMAGDTAADTGVIAGMK